MSFERTDGRAQDQLRPVQITPGFLSYAEGSVLIEMGSTRVICAASLEDRVPPFVRNSGQGWLTAEYAMLPRSTQTRTARETGRGGPSGRTHEIQRLIGRSLRAVADLKVLGERTLTIDCDVLQADGGTRTAAITGAYVAFALASNQLLKAGRITRPLTTCRVRRPRTPGKCGILGRRVWSARVRCCPWLEAPRERVPVRDSASTDFELLVLLEKIVGN